MRRILIPAALVVVLCLTVQAQAGSAQSLLDAYQVNLLEDVDYESGIIAESTTLAVGDKLFGMFKIDGVQSETGPLSGSGLRTATTNTFTGVFLLEVTTKAFDSTLGFYVFNFAPVSASEWTTLFGTSLAPTSDYSIGIVFDDDDAPGFINPSGGSDAFSAMLTAANGLELWEVGFPGGMDTDGTPVDTDLFWTAYARTDDLASLIAEPMDVTGSPRLTFNAALDTTEYGAGVQLLQHNWVFSDSWSDWQLQGRSQRGTSGYFGLLTDSEIWIKPTPEPGSLALLGLGLAAVGGFVVRRRRRS